MEDGLFEMQELGTSRRPWISSAKLLQVFNVPCQPNRGWLIGIAENSTARVADLEIERGRLAGKITDLERENEALRKECFKIHSGEEQKPVELKAAVCVRCLSRYKPVNN